MATLKKIIQVLNAPTNKTAIEMNGNATYSILVFLGLPKKTIIECTKIDKCIKKYKKSNKMTTL